jgi:hypothetical protein
MTRADIVFWCDEPVSFGYGLCQQLSRHGLCNAAIAMPYNHAGVMQILQRSTADCVVFLSPHMHADFIRRHHADLLALGKPLLGFVSEWVAGNDVFPEGRNFYGEANWLHYYAAAQASDVPWFRARGMKSNLTPLMFASDLFPALPWRGRIKELCYIGHNNAWKTERLRILKILDEARLIKGFTAPRNLVGTNGIAALFRQFAATLCPPAHGRGQSIRCYEAAASGALLVECQPLDEGNEFFVDGQHRVAFPEGLPAKELCDFIRSLDYDRLRGIAEAGCALAHREFRAEVVFTRFLDAARKALTEGG